ncbi:MAG TPA: Ig-like domain-containing protein [Verrucomicrobiae bacterium]|nr:Ig-like domain-containing protein [Verrucomicrobiae bacterium]
MLRGANDCLEFKVDGNRLNGIVSRASLLLTLWLAIPVPAPAADAPVYSLRWNTNSIPPVVEVSGIAAPILRQLGTDNRQPSDWQQWFSVYAGQGNFMADMNVPSMLGSYRVEAGLIRFEPKFPLERGVTYRAVFRPAKLPGVAQGDDIISRFQLPAMELKPTTVVAAIYPTADVLPENLLKFYVHFSAPMQGGHIYSHIHLRDEAGKAVELPFLEIDEELWNPEMTRLTLFIDPGRIKRGVQPLEEIGPVLEEGKRYTLDIDAGWRDGNGQPLKKSFQKSFRAGAVDRDPPTLASWKLQSPRAGSRAPLTVRFPEPMDQALALRVIGVVDPSGQLVRGECTVSEHETVWAFAPQHSWVRGAHHLQVQNTIEDLAGNNIGKAFEVDLFEGVPRRFTNAVVKLSFDVL